MRNFLFYILFIFILFPHNGLAQKQGASQETKRFEVLRDSGSFNFAIEELIKDEKIIQKYFTNIDYIKRADRNTLFLKQKNAIKASLRICVDLGNLGPHQGDLGPYPGNLGPYQGNLGPYQRISAIYEDTLYTKPINVISFHVEGIEKAERSVKVSIYDNFSNTCLAEKTYTLSPVIVHKYTPEIRYTDENGNSQVYTNETPCWIPTSTTSPVYFIVRDEYGKERKVLYFSVYTHCIFIGTPFGNNPIPITESDTLLAWQAEMLNRFKKNCPGYINATIEDENGYKKQVDPLKIDGGCR